MSSPYRHAVEALRERHEEVARVLDETDDTLAKLMTERMRLRIELDALESRLAAVRRPTVALIKMTEAAAPSHAKAHIGRGSSLLG